MTDTATYAMLQDPGTSTKDDRSSLLVTAAKVTKAVLGAGTLSLSWAYFYSTMWPGIFFTALMGLLAAMNFAFLGFCSEITDQDSYSAIWELAFGRRWAWITDVVTILFCLASTVAYLIIIGDYFPRGLNGMGLNVPILQDRRTCILLVSALLLPLNFAEDLSALGFTSVIGTAGSLYTCLVLLTEAGESGLDASDWEGFGIEPGLFVMIPAVTFAFNGHFNAPKLYMQLEARSPLRWALVTFIAYCFAISLICGTSGYLMFGSELSLPGRSDVLTAPTLQRKPEVMAAYLAMTLSVAFGIPIYGQSVCSSFETLWLSYAPSGFRSLGNRLARDTRRRMLAGITVAVTVGFSMILTDLGIINAVNGAICACLLMLVFPSLMYLKCSQGATSALRGMLAKVSIAIGILVGVCGVVTAFLLSYGVDLAC
eukprot:CAMPEP_0117473444 /NCGR_PEP_ID=MMETSP0784-20121206/8775_1 /TAXON_ID=39447 /ORGANISM="" /LENGTH=426 /DNA_ID=CAMNT_0005267645 /DNA_START=60 /DNA_END=1341 /DNA_ORIENTATION=+